MPKTLKFSPDLIPLVLSGKKTSTWRLFDDKDLQEGDQVEFYDKASGQKFSSATLIKVYEKPMGDLSAGDWEGHEKFISDQQMYDQYSDYYSREVGPQTIVKIINFKIL